MYQNELFSYDYIFEAFSISFPIKDAQSMMALRLCYLVSIGEVLSLISLVLSNVPEISLSLKQHGPHSSR